MGRENELLGTARDAFARQDWAGALESFQAARKAVDLSADDWFALADSAWWRGEIEAALDAWQEAHHRYVTTGQPRRAAMAAMFVAAHSMERGDTAVGSGWMSRMQRLLRDEPEAPEHGYPMSSRSSGRWELAISTERSRRPGPCRRSAAASTTRTSWQSVWLARDGR